MQSKSKRQNNKKRNQNNQSLVARDSKVKISPPFQGRIKRVLGPVATKMEAVPTTISISLGREYYTEQFKAQGKTGCKLVGRVPIASISNDASAGTGDGCLAPFLTTSLLAKGVALHPFTFFPANSQEIAEANNWTKFKFRKLNLHFTSTASSNQGRTVLISFYGDGSIVGGTPPTVDQAGLLPGAGTIVTWSPIRSFDLSKLLDLEEWYYIDLDNAGSDAGNRLTYQGAILGYWVTAGTAALIDGTLWADYELDLVETRPLLDIALRESKSSLKIHTDFRKPVRPGRVRFPLPLVKEVKERARDPEPSIAPDEDSGLVDMVDNPEIPRASLQRELSARPSRPSERSAPKK